MVFVYVWMEVTSNEMEEISLVSRAVFSWLIWILETSVGMSQVNSQLKYLRRYLSLYFRSKSWPHSGGGTQWWGDTTWLGEPLDLVEG